MAQASDAWEAMTLVPWRSVTQHTANKRTSSRVTGQNIRLRGLERTASGIRLSAMTTQGVSATTILGSGEKRPWFCDRLLSSPSRGVSRQHSMRVELE